MEHNLAKYLARHPECEVYCGQDQGGSGPTCTGEAENRPVGASAKPRAGPIQKRVTLWHRVQKRKVVGNAAPLEKNVHAYLAKHPEYEIYDAHGHEKEKDTQRAVEKVLTAIVTSVVALNRDLDEQTRPSVVSRKRKNQKHVSGGKRPKVGGHSSATSVSQDEDDEEEQEVNQENEEEEAAEEEEEEEQEQEQEEQEQEQEEPLAGLSYLLQIATNTVHVFSPDTSLTANEKGEAGDLLDLLVQATASAAVDAHTASKPESPPFSPMAQPAITESTKMELLSLAPSSVSISSVASFHRLS